MKQRNILIIGVASLLALLGLVVGAFFAGPLLASASSGQTTTTTAQGTNPYCEQYLQDLAHRLNVSVSTLEQDQLAARTDVVDQLVKDGKLTQAQANAIKQNMQKHQACSGKVRAMPWAHAIVNQFVQKYRSAMENEIASGMHLTTQQLMSQLKSGKSLSQIATAQHVSASQLHTIMTNAIEDALKKAVSAGDLTQDQANSFTQYLQKHPGFVDHLLNGHIGKKVA